MAHAYFHAKSSARKFGGKPEEYLHIHKWFDASRMFLQDWRHRALRHHTVGIQDAVALFGETLTLECGKEVPVLYIGEQHVLEDLGQIPTPGDWLQFIKIEKWMGAKAQKLSEEQ
jgi:hypothetical protein